MSDLISVECPNCSAPLKVKESPDTARKVHCPECKEAFVVEPRGDEPAPTARKKRAPAREDDEERGRAGGQRKKKRKAGAQQLVILGVASGVGLLVLGGIVLAVVLMPRGKKMTAPESFVSYSAPEGEFGCLVPADWDLKAAGTQNTRSLTVKKGSASIHIRQSLAGSLLGDIAGAGGGDAKLPDEHLPVSRVHDLKKAGVAEEFRKYEEEPATTVMTKGFGKARRSAFTSSGMAGKKRGYRATVLANMISYDIICQCPEADWAMLEPAFAKVIESLGHGGGR
jgi:hypothetical protein